MGVGMVFQWLTEMFPQVDSRILKAVAIEHCKDADAAAEAVICEVLPYLSIHSESTASSFCLDHMVSSSFLESTVSSSCHEENRTDHEEETDLSTCTNTNLENMVASSKEPRAIAKKIVSHDFETSTPHNDQAPNSPTDSLCAPVVDSNQFQRCIGSEILKHDSGEEDVQSGSDGVPGVLLNASVCEENTGCCQAGTNSRAMTKKIVSHTFANSVQHNDQAPNSPAGSCCAPIVDLNQFQGYIGSTFVKSDFEEEECCKAGIDSRKLQSSSNKCQDRNLEIWNEQDSGVVSFILLQKSDVQEDSDGLVPDDFDTFFDGKTSFPESITDAELSKVKELVIKQEEQNVDGPMADDFDMGSTSVVASKARIGDCAVEGARAADEDGLHSEFADKTRSQCESKQESKMDVLEKIIGSAKDNKKTLFSAMEAVMHMMIEVELQERDAEQAKKEASMAGWDILNQVEELKVTVEHAKEANEKRAGEFCGEKVILATEMRELQSRLLSLSDERIKTLALLNEMKQNLEARLAVVMELKRAAEQEKLEKEESARHALVEQESITEKVVREAKILQEEAEENSKLRDFLMDMGRVVDGLQGEIYVICKDARLLKEKLDERVPLSEFFSSSQTSCILASSGSSIKSRVSRLQDPAETTTTKSSKEESPESSIHEKSPKSSPREASPASSICVQSPKNSPQETSHASSIHVQSPKRSPTETNPSTSINGQLPNGEHRRIIGAALDDWVFFDDLCW